MIKFLQFAERVLLKVVDVIGGGFIWVGGGLALVIAALAGACVVIVSIVSTLAVPALCIVAIWGILHYFGVI
jgi:hypothetical protein